MDDNSNPMAPPEQRMKPMQHSIAADRIVTTDERSTRARVSNTYQLHIIIHLLSHRSKPYDYIIRASYFQWYSVVLHYV